jgi:hypothetical protein
MSLDARGGRCHEDGGARANCCKVDVTEKKVVDDKTMAELDAALKEFMADPTCPNPQLLNSPFAPNATTAVTGEQLVETIFGLAGGGVFPSYGPSMPKSRYDINFTNADSDASSIIPLNKRQRVNSRHIRFLIGWLGNIITHLRDDAILPHDLDRQAHIWDERVRIQNPELQVARLRENIPGWGLAIVGAVEAANEVLCHMNQMNEVFTWMREERNDVARAEERKKKHLPLDCAWDLCDREGYVYDPPSGEVFNPDGDPDIMRRSDNDINNLTMCDSNPLPYNNADP